MAPLWRNDWAAALSMKLKNWIDLPEVITDLGYEPRFARLPQTTVTTAFFYLATVVLELRQISLIFSVKTEKLKVECRGSVQ